MKLGKVRQAYWARLDYPTLYIAAEDGHAIAPRVAGWITHHKGLLSELAQFYPDDFDLMDESACKAIAAAAGKQALTDAWRQRRTRPARADHPAGLAGDRRL